MDIIPPTMESTVNEGSDVKGKTEITTVIGRVSTEFTYLPAKGRHAGEEIHQVAPRRDNCQGILCVRKERFVIIILIKNSSLLPGLGEMSPLVRTWPVK